MTTFDGNLIVIVAAVLVALALIVLRLFRRQRVSLSDQPTATERRSFAPRDMPGAAPPPLSGDVTLEATAIAAAAPPVAPLAPAVDDPAAAAEPLTVLKGLGPKAAARLAELGVTRMAQLAGLDEAEAARLDAQMGPFRGRLARDRWQEQARLLAAGDRDGFEAAFGKLG